MPSPSAQLLPASPSTPLSPWQDVALAAVITLACATLAAHFELSEAIFRNTRRWEHFQLDEWPVAAFVLALCFVWISWRRSQQAFLQLEARRAAERRLAAALVENRELAQQHLHVQEAERKHLARELHDELGQHLSAIRLELSFVRMRWGTDNPELREKVQSVQETIDGVIGLVRDLVARLRPVVLDMGIASALEWLICEFRMSSEVTCDLQIDEQVADLDPWQTSTVFRLVQESLTNIGRHARARNVQVSLQRQSDAYVLTVSDDGLGFDPTKIGIKSLGLQGMRERAEMLGGQLDLRTRPGDGTSIIVTFPISAATA